MLSTQLLRNWPETLQDGMRLFKCCQVVLHVSFQHLIFVASHPRLWIHHNKRNTKNRQFNIAISWAQHYMPFDRVRGSSECNLCCTRLKAFNLSACSWCCQILVSRESVPAAGVAEQAAPVTYGPAGLPFHLIENCMTLIKMKRHSVITVFFSLSDMWLSYKGECICNRCL